MQCRGTPKRGNVVWVFIPAPQGADCPAKTQSARTCHRTCVNAQVLMVSILFPHTVCGTSINFIVMQDQPQASLGREKRADEVASEARRPRRGTRPASADPASCDLSLTSSVPRASFSVSIHAPLDWPTGSQPILSAFTQLKASKASNRGGIATRGGPLRSLFPPITGARKSFRGRITSLFFFTHTHTHTHREDEVQQYPGGRVEEGRRREVLQGTGEARVVFRPFASAGGEG